MWLFCKSNKSEYVIVCCGFFFYLSVNLNFWICVCGYIVYLFGYFNVNFLINEVIKVCGIIFFGEYYLIIIIVYRGQVNVIVEFYKYQKQYLYFWLFEVGIDIYVVEFEYFRYYFVIKYDLSNYIFDLFNMDFCIEKMVNQLCFFLFECRQGLEFFFVF